MFFITALDFWINRLEEHMQKIIAENAYNTSSIKLTKVQPSTEWLILDIFKISKENMPVLPKEKKQAAEQVDLSSFKMKYGESPIQYNLYWKDIVGGEHGFLLGQINEFFNPENTGISLTEFKLLLVFRLQQKCLALREAAYLNLKERDDLNKLIKKQQKLVFEKKDQEKDKEKEKKENIIVNVKIDPFLKESEKNKQVEELVINLEFDPVVALEKSLGKLKISSEQCGDKILLDQLLKNIKDVNILMRTLEEKAEIKLLKQVTYTPSDGRTGELFHGFSKTMEEIFNYFHEVDNASGLLPGVDQAILDCSPKKVFKRNDPLLIVYENMVSYLLSNYRRLAEFERLNENAVQSGAIINAMSSLYGLVTQPTKTINEKLTLWTYDTSVSDEKRTKLSSTILALRKSLSGQPILDQQKRFNEGLWDNCDRTLIAGAEEAFQSQGYSFWPQQLTLFFEKTREDLKASRENLQKQASRQGSSLAGKKSINERK